MRDDDFSDRLHRSANFSGFTPLHYAALGDSLECVQLLVNAGNFFELFLIKITFINAQDQSILPLMLYGVIFLLTISPLNHIVRLRE